MLRFDRDTLQTLVSIQEFPCVSIYLPILREGNDVKMSQIRLRTLLRQAEDHLKGNGLTVPKIQNILKPASELLEQPLFWAVAPEALAMFMSDNQSVIFSLEQPVDENIVIDDHFTVRPLLELDVLNAEYLLLAIGRGAVRVYRGSKNRLIQIPVQDLPESLETIVSAYSFEKQRRQYGGAAGSNHGAVAGAVSHGFENSKDRDRLMVEDYCRAVDGKILEHWQKENLPLVLASVDYLFAVFQKVSKNPNLLPVKSPVHLTTSPKQSSGTGLGRSFRLICLITPARTGRMPRTSLAATGSARTSARSSRRQITDGSTSFSSHAVKHSLAVSYRKHAKSAVPSREIRPTLSNIRTCSNSPRSGRCRTGHRCTPSIRTRSLTVLMPSP